MSRNSLRCTSLPVDDPQALWLALQGQVDPKELLRVDSSTRSVHAFVLSWYLTAASDEEALQLRDCCLRLIELKAPMTDDYGNGAAAQFCGYPWPTDREQLDQVGGLADAYRNAGWWDLEQPLDGQVITRAERAAQEGDIYDGLKPLAAAIIGSNPGLARFLCERGASLELGVTFAGEAPVHAIGLALEEREGEIHAIVVDTAMRRRLGDSPTEVSTENSADSSVVPLRHRRASL
jgi:hypothetical protein